MTIFFSGFATHIVVNKRHVVFFSPLNVLTVTGNIWLLYGWHSLRSHFRLFVRLHAMMCFQVKDAGLLTEVKCIKKVSTVPLSVASVSLTEPCHLPESAVYVHVQLNRDEKARCLTMLKQV